MRALLEYFRDDPLTGAAFAAGLFAIATTPIAFAILSRTTFFETRRGRTFQKPTFSSVVSAMMLVMGIPAIFCAITAKSRHFDENRYAFDPNKTWTPLEQGRGYYSIQQADEAVRKEMQLLGEERKNLVNGVKKLDEAMLVLRAASSQSPATAKAMPAVLERLATVRAAVGVDGPQQLIDATAPPAALRGAGRAGAVAVAPLARPVAPVAPTAGGLSKAEVEADLAAVPGPQKPLAAMLPLADLPEGWEVGKSGASHVETFNAENLFEKIDGRAESFIQYDVKGMAYTYYHPTGDESNEVQLYIFEMGNSLKALGKYGSEKPDGVKALPIGSEGYASAGSTLFHAGPYYTQIVSTKDDPKFAAFALGLAKRIAAQAGPEAGHDLARRGRAEGVARGDLRPPAEGAEERRRQIRRAGRLRLQLPGRCLHGRLPGRRRQVAGLPPPLCLARGGEGDLRPVRRGGQEGRRRRSRNRRSRAGGWSPARTSRWSTRSSGRATASGASTGPRRPPPPRPRRSRRASPGRSPRPCRRWPRRRKR